MTIRDLNFEYYHAGSSLNQMRDKTYDYVVIDVLVAYLVHGIAEAIPFYMFAFIGAVMWLITSYDGSKRKLL